MHDFDLYDLKKAQDIVSKRFDAQAAINIAFLRGDHWNSGEFWTGPRPVTGDAYYGVKMAAIEAAQITRNVIAELVSRHTNGVLAKELHWKFTVNRDIPPIEVIDEITGQTSLEDGQPSEQENALIAEAESVLVGWWDEREITEILQNMLDGALCAKRSPLRLYVPPGLRDDNGNLPSGDLAQCLDYIYLQNLSTNEDTLEQQVPSATVYTDKNNRRDVGLFSYKEGDKEFAELTYLDDNGQTVLRIINADGNVMEPLAYPLGGRLTIYELTRKALISPQIVSQQKALNKTLTMQGRNDDLGGFLERTYLNVKWPVDVDAAGNETPQTLFVGAGSMNSLQGMEYTDSEGKTHLANPSVVYRDPVSPSTFIESEQSTYLAMLSEGQQLHYASASDAVVSGESRKQAREAFSNDLQSSAGKVESAARWVLETALAMAAYFAGRAGAFEGLRVYAQCRIDSGPMSADEMRIAIELVDARLISRESGMSRVGVEDVDAESARIEQEQASQQVMQANMARVALDEAQRRFNQDGNGDDEPLQRQNGTPPQQGDERLQTEIS